MPSHSSKTHPGLERVPGKQNWVDHAGGLPNYIERIAKHIHADSGYTISHAIASAVNRVKKLIATGSPATKAKAAKALAQWEAKKKRGNKNLTDGELIKEVVINMSESPGDKAGTKSAGVTDKKKLLAAIALYRSKKSSYSPEERAKIEARLKSSQQRLGMKVGLSEEEPVKKDDKLEQDVALFLRTRHRLDLSEQETIKKYLEGRAAQTGVTINLSAAPEGTIIARQTRFNPTKHNRGFGGRFAPKVQ